MNTKPICKVCNKPFSYKFKQANGEWYKMGTNRSTCFECKPIRHRNNDVEVDGKKICNGCHQLLSTDNFYVNTITGKFKSLCKKCHNLKMPARHLSKQIINKKKAIEYKGGKCERCGYDKFYGAIEFHHRDLKSKTGDISFQRQQNKDFEYWKPELDKCMILCANCHREVHNEIYLKNQII